MRTFVKEGLAFAALTAFSASALLWIDILTRLG